MLEGKYKGFFVDDYKLLGLLEQQDPESRFRAQNTKTGKLVTLLIVRTKFIQSADGTIYSIVEA